MMTSRAVIRIAAVAVLLVALRVSGADSDDAAAARNTRPMKAAPSVNYRPSRATPVERKLSLKTKERAETKEKMRKDLEPPLTLKDLEAQYAELIKRREELENDVTLDDETRAETEESLKEEEASIRSKRGRKGLDPLYDMRKRRGSNREPFDSDVQVHEYHAPEQIANISEMHESNGLHEYLNEHSNHVALLVVEGNCEQCDEAWRVFQDVAARIADDEYHLGRAQRYNRFAFLNASVSPERYAQLMKHGTYSDPEMHHLPVVFFIEYNTEGQKHPHYVTYRHGRFASDVEHALRRVQHRIRNDRFHNADELMFCAFDRHSDGMALVSFHDAMQSEHYEYLYRMVGTVVEALHYDMPFCAFHGHRIDHTDSANPGEIASDTDFLDTYNPSGADFAIFYTNETDPDHVMAEPYTIGDRRFVTQRNFKPTRMEYVVELQRLRRWVERGLGRRHASSGRRFHKVHRRQVYQHHGHEDGTCHDEARAVAGDTVTARINATSVEHDHVFFTTGGVPREFIVGDAVDGLPPWLHDIFTHACAPSHREVYSPPKEGFHAELVDVEIIALRKTSKPQPPQPDMAAPAEVLASSDDEADFAHLVSEDL